MPPPTPNRERWSRTRTRRGRRADARAGASGQAAVELVALLPLIVLLGLLAWQAVVAGQAVWLSGSAARAAARASALGRDPAQAARAVLPDALARGVAVRVVGDGAVRLRLVVPSVVADLHLASIRTRARFAPQGGS
jgi:hypothetical protein